MGYKTKEDVDFRLANTIVSYAGEPVLVRQGTTREGLPGVSFKEHPFTGPTATKSVDDPLFNDFKPVPLGFLNYFRKGINDCAYAERLPLRRSKQGLSSESFRCSTLANEFRHDWEDVTRSDGFREMVVGMYPTFDEVLALLVPSSSIAVSREFAIRMDEGGVVNLFFKREKIGTVFRGALYVSSEYQYMIEAILDEPNLPNNVEVM